MFFQDFRSVLPERSLLPLPDDAITRDAALPTGQEQTVGTITIENEGKVWNSDAFIQRRISLVPGKTFFQHQLEADLLRLNQNPTFREVSVTCQPGAANSAGKPATDLVFKVKDRFPLRAYAGYDNAGIKVLGEDRLFAGFSYGNLFGADHQLNYQYTTDLDLKALQSHAASYVAPLPWGGHTLTVFGGCQDADADLGKVGIPVFREEDRVDQTSLRYTMPLPPWKRLRHEMTAGFDFKQNELNIFFGGLSVFKKQADINQFVVGYRGCAADRLGYTGWRVTGFGSPGGLMGHNDNADFYSLIWGAPSEYLYGRLEMERAVKLPARFQVTTRAGGQLSSDPLLPGERLSTGGANVIRGYPEHVTSGETGWYAISELHLPRWRTSDLTRQQVGDYLDAFVFLDYASVHTKGVPGNPDLVSVGPGLSYRVGQNLVVNMSYGFQLTDMTDWPWGYRPLRAYTEDDGRFHLAATLSY